MFNTQASLPSEDVIQTFENFFNLILPDEYKEFLKKFGGGYLSEGFDILDFSKETSSLCINQFFCIQKDANVSDLAKEIDKYKSIAWQIGDTVYKLPEGILPIGDDVFGNYYYLGLTGDKTGKVYFWSHDGNPIKGFEEQYDDLYFLSPSLTHTLKHLTKYRE